MFILGLIGLIGIMMVISTLMNGWVFCVFWNWFFVSAFNLSPLTLVQAMGVGLVVTFLTYQHDSRGDFKGGVEEFFTDIVLKPIARPLFALFLGWIIHLFM